MTKNAVMPGTEKAPQVGTRLLRKRDEQEVLTEHRECDARTALTRGLAEYLITLSVEMPYGRRHYFQQTYDTAAEFEDGKALYPAAVVKGLGAGEYEFARMTPEIVPKDRTRMAPGLYLVAPSELGQDVQIEVYATSPVERAALVAMLEDGLNPTDWSYGVRLMLPHYHGAHATYQPNSIDFMDDESNAMQRRLKAVVNLTAWVQTLRVMHYPEAKPRQDLVVT